MKHRSYSQPDLFVTDVKPGSTPKNLTTAYDYDIGGGIGGDQGPPRGASGFGSKPYWTADGRAIVVGTGEEGRGNLKRIDAASGGVTALTEGNHDIYSYSPTADGSKLAVLISTPTNIGDLFMFRRRRPHDPDHAHQRRAILATQPDRAGDDLVQELRRQAHRGLGAASAGFPGRQEVSA